MTVQWSRVSRAARGATAGQVFQSQPPSGIYGRGGGDEPAVSCTRDEHGLANRRRRVADRANVECGLEPVKPAILHGQGATIGDESPRAVLIGSLFHLESTIPELHRTGGLDDGGGVVAWAWRRPCTEP